MPDDEKSPVCPQLQALLELTARGLWLGVKNQNLDLLKVINDFRVALETCLSQQTDPEKAWDEVARPAFEQATQELKPYIRRVLEKLYLRALTACKWEFVDNEYMDGDFENAFLLWGNGPIDEDRLDEIIKEALYEKIEPQGIFDLFENALKNHPNYEDLKSTFFETIRPYIGADFYRKLTEVEPIPGAPIQLKFEFPPLKNLDNER
jgi:hypothetical protein